MGVTTSNYIGKPSYSGDAYLQDSKVADFRIYNRAITPAEVITLAGVTAPDDYPQSILAEREALVLGDLSAVVSDITLPIVGTTDTDVAIVWASSNRSIIDTVGQVVQPEDLDVKVKLTATFTKNGYSVSKEFFATVLASGGFEDVLILNWDFSPEWVDADNGIVTDAAEKHFEGALQNGSKVRKIGTSATGEFYTLDLGGDDGYFDMGTDVGKLVYGLSNYTIAG